MELPYNLEAEKQVIANMLTSDNTLVETATRLSADDFYFEKNKILYKAIIDIFKENKVKIEPSAIIDRLAIDNNLDKVGTTYVSELYDSFSDVSNSKYFITSVEEKSILRQLLLYCEDVTNKWQEETASIGYVEYINGIEKTIAEICKKRKIEDFIDMNKAVDQFKEIIENVRLGAKKNRGIITDIKELDKLTGGFQPGDLIILAARPSVGKSALALNFLVNAAKHTDKLCVMFSLEMSIDSLMNRILAFESKINSKTIKDATFNKNEEYVLSAAMKSLKDSPIYIDETPGIKVMDMTAKLQKLTAATRKDVGIVIVDYIGLISPDFRKKNSDNRALELGEISKSLKALARNFNCPVIALSQLSRDIEKRVDKTPVLSDLRESGSIEQDADIVMFIHRKDYQKVKDKEEQNSEDGLNSSTDQYNEEMSKVQLLVSKHRNGQLGKIELAFMKNIGKFYEYDKMYEESQKRPKKSYSGS